MVETKHITSIAQLRTLGDRILTECYVIGIGFSGLTAVSEHPVAIGSSVFADLAYVNERGEVEGETVKGRVLTCEPRPGAHLLNLAFLNDLRADPRSRLARHIRRELGLSRRTDRQADRLADRQTGPSPPLREREAEGG